MRSKLTEQAVARRKPPKTGRDEIDDLVVPGLVLRVTDKGAKSWSLLYRVAGEGGETATGLPKRGKLRRITLGRHPAMGLKAAREAARKALETADAGTDPVAVRAGELIERCQQRARTVRAVCEEYIEKHAKPKTRNWEGTAACLNKYLLAAWGDRPFTDIKRKDVIDLIDEVAASVGGGAAINVMKSGRAVWNWAWKRELVTSNPFAKVDVPHDPVEQERALEASEIAVVWQAACRLGYPFGDLVRLLLLTGQRRTNIAQMQWSWLDLGAATMTIPKQYYKGKRTHLVPLSRNAMQLIAGLPRFRAGDFVLTTTHGRRPISGFSTAKNKLDAEVLAVLRQKDPQALPLDPWKLHDLRRTVATGLQKLNYDPVVIDKVLGHSFAGLRAVYMKHDYRTQKAEALEAWGEYLRLVVGEAGDNVRAIG